MPSFKLSLLFVHFFRSLSFHNYKLFMRSYKIFKYIYYTEITNVCNSKESQVGHRKDVTRLLLVLVIIPYPSISNPTTM